MRGIALQHGAIVAFPEPAETRRFGREVRGVLPIEVVDRRMRDQRLERVFAAEDEGGEVAAVAAAAGNHALAIDPRLRGEPVRSLDHVLIRLLRPLGIDRIREVLAETGAAVEVRPCGDVAPTAEHLRVPAESHAVGDRVVRAAVDQHEERILFRAVETRRIVHPHLDVLAVRALVGHRFVGADLGGRQQRIVDRRKFGRGAAAGIDPHQRRRFDETLAQADQRAAVGYRQRVERCAGGDLARRAIQRQVVDAHGAGVVDRAVQAAAVARPHQATGAAVPVGEQFAGFAGAAVLQHQPALVGVETADALLYEAEVTPVRAVLRPAVAGLVGGGEIARVLAAAAVRTDGDGEDIVVAVVDRGVGIGDEGQLLAVGRDREMAIGALHRAARQLQPGRLGQRAHGRQLGAVGRGVERHRKHVELALIEILVPGRDRAAVPDHRGHLAVLALVQALALIGQRQIGEHPRHERQALAVGEPFRALHAGGDFRQPPRFAAAERHHVQLRRLVVAALRGEGDGFSVGADGGRAVVRRIGGEPALAAAVRIPDPQVDVGLVFVHRKPRDRRDDGAAVAGQRGRADALDLPAAFGGERFFLRLRMRGRQDACDAQREHGDDGATAHVDSPEKDGVAVRRTRTDLPGSMPESIAPACARGRPRLRSAPQNDSPAIARGAVGDIID